MKQLIYLIVSLSLVACQSNKTDVAPVATKDSLKTEISIPNETAPIIGERIDGPANVRHKPNGEVLFELYDDALVEFGTSPDNGWYQVLVYATIAYDEYAMDTIQKGRPLLVNNDTIGRVLKSHYVSTARGRDVAYAILFGYTHQNNIKPETVIETRFKMNLTENGRDFSAWKGFIETFKLEKDAVEYAPFQSYYNYEHSLEDPSPGFRLVLLFDDHRLVGLIHSRALQIENATPYKLQSSYEVTFFDDYPKETQMKFVEYMNQWIQGVD